MYSKELPSSVEPIIKYAPRSSIGINSFLVKLKRKIDPKTTNIINPDINENFNQVQINDQRNNAIALYDRFGLILSFYKASKEEYLSLVSLYAKINRIKINKDLEKQALRWSIVKGDYSGRTAVQFITNLKSKTL